MNCKDCGRCQRCLAKKARETVERNKAEPERRLLIMQLDLDTGRMVPCAQPRADGTFFVQADGIIFQITKRDEDEGIEVSVTGRGDANRSLISIHPRSGNAVRVVAVAP